MNNVLCNTADTLLVVPGEMHELVRGQEQVLLEQLTPLVCKQDVSLDLRRLERIDAAGIAALISLYACAHRVGHDFTIANASPRIAEILALVGLDHILMNHGAMADLPHEPCLGRPAA